MILAKRGDDVGSAKVAREPLQQDAILLVQFGRDIQDRPKAFPVDGRVGDENPSVGRIPTSYGRWIGSIGRAFPHDIDGHRFDSRSRFRDGLFPTRGRPHEAQGKARDTDGGEDIQQLRIGSGHRWLPDGIPWLTLRDPGQNGPELHPRHGELLSRIPHTDLRLIIVGSWRSLVSRKPFPVRIIHFDSKILCIVHPSRKSIDSRGSRCHSCLLQRGRSCHHSSDHCS